MGSVGSISAGSHPGEAEPWISGMRVVENMIPGSLTRCIANGGRKE